MVRDLDPANELTFLRLRSTKNEVLIAPGQLGVTIFVGFLPNWQREVPIPPNIRLKFGTGYSF